MQASLPDSRFRRESRELQAAEQIFLNEAHDGKHVDASEQPGYLLRLRQAEAERQLIHRARQFAAERVHELAQVHVQPGERVVSQGRTAAGKERRRSRQRLRPVSQQVQAARRGRVTGPARQGKQDRKSTRLNSSHVAISYAVFCLKKKKTTTAEQ